LKQERFTPFLTSSWASSRAFYLLEIVLSSLTKAQRYLQQILALILPHCIKYHQPLSTHYPKRWHIEEFFNTNLALGWKRAGTLNLNIRYGCMTMALIAQTVIHQLRLKLCDPFRNWTAQHFAQNLFLGLDGDIRVYDDTIRVTYYNAPNTERLRRHYQNFPAKHEHNNVDPRIPWLYGFKLDFRFK